MGKAVLNKGHILTGFKFSGGIAAAGLSLSFYRTKAHLEMELSGLKNHQQINEFACLLILCIIAKPDGS